MAIFNADRRFMSGHRITGIIKPRFNAAADVVARYGRAAN
jgi:hypothetical protein